MGPIGQGPEERRPAAGQGGQPPAVGREDGRIHLLVDPFEGQAGAVLARGRQVHPIPRAHRQRPEGSSRKAPILSP